MGKLIFPVKEMAEAPADGEGYARKSGGWSKYVYDFNVTVLGSASTTSDWVLAASGDWSGSYIATIDDVTGILAGDEPILDIDLSGLSFATYEEVVEGYSFIFRGEVTANNTVVLYASEEPAPNIPLKLKVVR
jgi:hypothetical protein